MKNFFLIILFLTGDIVRISYRGNDPVMQMWSGHEGTVVSFELRGWKDKTLIYTLDITGVGIKEHELVLVKKAVSICSSSQ